MRRRPSRRALNRTETFDLDPGIKSPMPRDAGSNRPPDNEAYSDNLTLESGKLSEWTDAYGRVAKEKPSFEEHNDRTPRLESGVQEVKVAVSMVEFLEPTQPKADLAVQIEDAVQNPSSVMSSRDRSNTKRKGVLSSMDKPDMPLRRAHISPTKIGAPKSDVFDKLSKSLAGHALGLTEEDKQREEDLRQRVVDSLKDFRTDRSNLGKYLSAYKSVYKSERQWTQVVSEIGKVIRVSARTVFRIIEEYELGGRKKPSKEKHVKSPIYGPTLSKEEKAEMRARRAIRALLADTHVNKKAEFLAAVLGEEIHQIWGLKEDLLIKIAPTDSKFTFDGRKKTAPEAAKEEAA
jgi:hypothetical protein